MNTKQYIKDWQDALTNEILHLKKFGSNKFRLHNGRLLNSKGGFTYYFETSFPVKIPVGSLIRLEWGSVREKGKILSSEGKSVMLTLEHSIGDLLHEAYLFHDPWELLEQLITRFDEIKKVKQRRVRIGRLMDPSMPAKHPEGKGTSNVHELVLRSKYNPVTFVWGPPGTGKTYTLARVAANKYFQGRKVLILSHSNQAVDVLIGEISSFIKRKNRFHEGDILRYGSNAGELIEENNDLTTSQLLKKQDPELSGERDMLMEERKLLKLDLSKSFSKRDTESLLTIETKISRILEKIRKRELQFVKDAHLIGTTLAKAASDPAIYEGEFDLVILDEASMAYVPQAAFAATLAKRVIICGDFKQLPPIASSRDALVAKWLKEDIFHRAGVTEWVGNGTLHPHLFLLQEQRRMHPDISAFTNKYVYGSLVGDHPAVEEKRKKLSVQSPFPEKASVLLDTSFMGGYCTPESASKSRINPWQLLLSFQVIHEAYVAGFRSIGYVTPYRAQAGLMEILLNDLYEKERSLGDIISATVHRFQGSERDVMIFDTVDSYTEDRAGMLLTGKDSERLINVAITRTKAKFIHVSDVSFLKKRVYKSKTLRQLIDHQEEMGQAVHSESIGKWIRHQHIRLNWVHALKLDYIFNDISSAEKEIMICLPADAVLSEEWTQQLLKIRDSVKLILLGGTEKIRLSKAKKLPSLMPYPFVIIDRQLLWLGLPLEGAAQIKPPYVTARLQSAPFIDHFLSQI